MDDTDVPLFPEAPAVTVEQTLAIIKPDAIHFADEIVEEIKSRGFTITQKRRLRLSPEQATDFYAEHYGKMFFPSLIAFMHSDDILVLVLAKPGAVQEWREMIGPTHPNKARQLSPESLRARYGTDQTRNAVHGSDSYFGAEREIRFMFPGTVTEPVYGGQLARDYLQAKVNPVLVQGLTQLCKQKPEDPVTWLAEWLLQNNPNKPLVEEPLT
ncbi:Nucleoside diphosphate kinase homolog 5 [Geodia barretti]|uniref:Nucleoside diphosphate kinase homolog 5 n=1 Tax=Geodia barretti TaxID=519541 RepID=A0AA35X951_GEOBA|nr:Nucleoside diphosphate kinase homolog 5 [Geodia barretti]